MLLPLILLDELDLTGMFIAIFSLDSTIYNININAYFTYNYIYSLHVNYSTFEFLFL